jgi:hypothetical protein
VIAWALGEPLRGEDRDDIHAAREGTDQAHPRPRAEDAAAVRVDEPQARPSRMPADAIARRRAMAAKHRAA